MKYYTSFGIFVIWFSMEYDYGLMEFLSMAGV